MKLTPSQDYAVQTLASWFNSDNSIAVLEAPAGYGKALPLNEPVLTDKGWVTMGELTLSDLVVSESGKFIQVLEIYEQTNLDIYCVTFSDGSTVNCCIDHLWEVQTADMRKRGTYKVLSLRDMLPKIQRTKTIKDTYTYSVRLTKPVEFPDLAIPDPYTLGYAIGNGHSGRSSLVCATGVADRDEIASYIPADCILSVAERSPTVGIIAIAKEFRFSYTALGLDCLRSKSKFIPLQLFTASVDQRKALLAGLVDSDGTCTNNKAKFATSSDRLARDFVQLVRSLGGTAKISVSDTFYREISVIEYTVVFRTPFNPFRLLRKANGYSVRMLDLVGNKRIVSAIYIGKQDGRCILVDSPRHLFLTRDYTVTHNTYLVCHFLDYMGRRCKPLLLAETNEAVNVLKASVRGKYTTKTVCSAFNLVMGNVEGIKQIVQHNSPDFKDVNIVIVDEASMPDSERLQLILSTCIGLGIHVLLIGHSSQLPPVNSRNDDGGCLSPAFIDEEYINMGYEVPVKLELTEPVRNTTEIYRFCSEVESLLTKRGVIGNEFEVPSSFLVKYLQTPEGIRSFHDGNTIALAYTNKRVAELNAIVRFGIFRQQAVEELFIAEDRLILRQPTRCFKRKLTGLQRNMEGVLKESYETLTTNTKAVVKEITFKEILGITCWELLIVSNHFNDKANIGYVYYPLTRDDVVALYHKLNNNALWDKGNTRQRKFDIAHAVGGVFGVDARDSKHDLKHGYAMTVDQSQGSSIDNVIVDDVDIRRYVKNRVLKIKVSYVAYSRARLNLWRLQ